MEYRKDEACAVCTHDCLFCMSITVHEDNKYTGICNCVLSPKYGEEVTHTDNCNYLSELKF